MGFLLSALVVPGALEFATAVALCPSGGGPPLALSPALCSLDPARDLGRKRAGHGVHTFQTETLRLPEWLDM